MRIAGIYFGIGIDACHFPLPTLRERQELQAEPEDLLARPQRQLDHATVLCWFALNEQQGSRIYPGQLGESRGLRRHKAAGKPAS
jgi:hypothetical protein